MPVVKVWIHFVYEGSRVSEVFRLKPNQGLIVHLQLMVFDKIMDLFYGEWLAGSAAAIEVVFLMRDGESGESPIYLSSFALPSLNCSR